jgi:DNA-binding winged helix-turn-helix (wHTH) protein
MQALEALELSAVTVDSFRGQKATQEAITALRTALGQVAQEPSAWRDMVVATLVREGIDKHRARELADHFAAQPEQRKPLTDEEIAEVAERMEAIDATSSFWREFARAIEQAHNIKEQP